MNSATRNIILCVSIIHFTVLPARADVKPAALFSDHMVMQAGMPVPIWGMADAGEQVTATVNGVTQNVTASSDGHWMLKLNDLKSGGPYEMKLDGRNHLVIHDILIGEVWLGSGQSNMEFTVSKAAKRFAGVNNEAEEIAAADYPTIRMFTVKMALSETPVENCTGSWEVCSPATVGSFSAVGYFFSRELQKSIHQPIGFINASYGASVAQAWISKADLQTDPRFKSLLDDLETQKLAFATSRPKPATQPAGSRRERGPANPISNHSPFMLWNAMLHPVQPYAIRGALWYQGESIIGGTEMYSQLMEMLIKTWRRDWREGDFPFYFVQLAALDNNSNRPEVREAQAKALSLPNTAMAVTIDIGDKSNVHPKNKQDLGERLARIARANAYGEKVEFSGPAYESMKVGPHSIRLAFTHIGGGLVTKDGELKQFEIAGADRKFVPAMAKIDGDSVLVTSDEVSAPVAVRYAWNRYPSGCNLYNKAGLPAPPFTTDH